MNPKHIKKIEQVDRIAKAPYNFVELPDKVVEAEDLPNGDRYHLERHTGRIECTLTTKSQLYTRCGWSPKDFAEHGEKAFKDLPDDIKHKRANFFINPATQKPIVPGSSIRGMLRTLVEIVSFGKIDRVTENKLFYRSLGDPALKYIYPANFVDNLGDVQHSPNPKAPCYHSKVHAGFLCKRNNSYVIEKCGYGRIDRHSNNRVIPNLPSQANLPTKPIYQGTGPGKIPSWTYQHQTVYVAIDRSEQDYFFRKQMNRNGGQRHPDFYLRLRKIHSASFTAAPNLQKGTLVITGDMQHKHLEFVFLDENLKEYPVTEEMVRRFQDDDQITKWQKDAYPQDKPSNGCRQQNGYIRDGEPVFFLLNNDGETVRFFGRAQMFRLPYEHSPLDFVPPKLRDTSRTDIAEAIFGYLNGKKPREQTCAGRVFISDDTLKPNQEEKVKPSLDKTPESILLSSPKPTTFQHYLVQQDVTQDNLKHYANKPPTDTEAGETVIRGHKLYWHKPCKIAVPADSDTQTSLVKPIDPEIDFTFKVYFENLSNVELGALLWVLSLSSDKSQTLETGKQGEKYCFSLGMGKPLGMGAVNIDYELHLSDRKERYKNLFNGTKWKTGEEDQSQTPEKEEESVKAFEKYILDWICCQDYPKERNREQLQHLKQLPRIEMLLAMLRCDPPNAKQTRYMTIKPDNEYKDRPVLPTPLDVMRIPDNRRCDGTSSNSNSNLPKPIIKKSSPEISNQKTHFNSPKPEPKQKTDRDEGGSGVNLATQRPSKPPKR
ncbi:TIGR03986 family CRISPR-associated RAMP protein [Microcoleus sp. F10-C6]|uniref:TIGR03986 family type III CRISPR-associated RAMP protein n=1 Tax=unclassified Microcoleus TaxID=2642155 RepID=UPI002FD095E4